MGIHSQICDLIPPTACLIDLVKELPNLKENEELEATVQRLLVAYGKLSK